LPYSSIDISPFKVRNSFKARTLFNWTIPELAPELILKPSSNRARQRVQLIQDSWKLARDIIARSQVRITKSANTYKREVDFDIRDHVWLSIKYWNTARA
jgi:hypothetical protein